MSHGSAHAVVARWTTPQAARCWNRYSPTTRSRESVAVTAVSHESYAQVGTLLQVMFFHLSGSLGAQAWPISVPVCNACRTPPCCFARSLCGSSARNGGLHCPRHTAACQATARHFAAGVSGETRLRGARGFPGLAAGGAPVRRSGSWLAQGSRTGLWRDKYVSL